MSGDAKLFWLRKGSTFAVSQWNPYLAKEPGWHPVSQAEAKDCQRKQNELNAQRAANKVAGVDTADVEIAAERKRQAKLIADGLVPPTAFDGPEAVVEKPAPTLDTMDVGQVREKATEMNILVEDDMSIDEIRAALKQACERNASASALEDAPVMSPAVPEPPKRGPGRPKKSAEAAE